MDHLLSVGVSHNRETPWSDLDSRDTLKFAIALQNKVGVRDALIACRLTPSWISRLLL
jgi:hypothetical protein